MRLDLVLAPRKRIIPATERDVDRLAAFRVGDMLPVQTHGKPRNGGNHRRFFAMVRFIAENHPLFTTEEDVLVELKLRAGHYREHITSDGEIVYIPKSIDYETLDEVEFREFFDKAITAATADMLPNLSPVKLKAYLDEIVSFA